MLKEDVLRMIEEEGVEFIRLQFTDILGTLKNIAVTPGQMEKVFANRYSVYGSAVFANRYDYDDKLYLYPDIDTFTILPWRPQQGKVAKIVCDVKKPDDTDFECSSRYILSQAVEAASKKGYTMIADPECEFFLFHVDENGLPTTTSHERAEFLDVGPSDFGENARRDIVLMLEDMGFEIESSHHEFAPAQHEIDFKEDEAMKMADSIQTFKFAVRSIAKRFGMYATFMPKPRQDVAGSGMHIHLKLMKDGKNIFMREDGEISEEALYFTGGIMAHAPALCAIANPTVNSYKRLLLGYCAPQKINWADHGEKALVVINRETDDVKAELRFPDGAANPYLLFAACLMAGLDGIENKLSPGPSLDESDKEKDRSLPEDLREAIDELNKDKIVKGALGTEFTDIFTKIKRTEWRSFISEVTPWEIDRYLTRL